MSKAPRASSECPICGVDSPHHHTAEEVDKYYKLQELDGRIISELASRVEQAQKFFKEYKNSCPACRMLQDGLIRATVGTFSPFGLGHKESDYGGLVRCRRCNRVIYTDECF